MKDQVSNFHSIECHFNILARIGYTKIWSKEISPLKRKLHRLYRVFVLIVVLAYNVQHIIRVIQVRNHKKKSVFLTTKAEAESKLIIS